MKGDYGMTKRVAITTADNPYNPFTEWDQWYVYDLQHGYGTCERLASINITSDELSDAENFESTEQAIDVLLQEGAFDKNGNFVEYKKVYTETQD
jgi:hypothetical protein